MWTENSTLCGVPQGANASHILANAYLYPLDIFLDNLKSSNDFNYFRYVDDTVIMAKSADTINHIVSKVVIFLRQYNLKINSKSKLEKLKNTDTIEEKKFYNPYGQINETSIVKIAKISKKVLPTVKKIINGKEVKKIDISGLNYYLKAMLGMEELANPLLLDSLISIIPKKPSLVFLICRYLGFYFSEGANFLGIDERDALLKYEKVWKIYKHNSLTQWTKFWLLKILSASKFAKNHTELQEEIDRIITDPNAKFLRPLAFFYRAYTHEQIDPFGDLGFTLDDIKRHILNAKTETEKSIYYYFAIYLGGTEDSEAIKELLYEALQDNSMEVQTMGLFLFKKLYHLFEFSAAKLNERQVVTEVDIKWDREITGGLSRIYFKLPPIETQKTKIKEAGGDYLTFEGKIAKDQFTHLLGISKPVKRYSKTIENRLKFFPESGDINYKSAIWQFKRGKKGYELIAFLYKNKNTNWNTEDIKKSCNPNIKIAKHKFKTGKDIWDTAREIKFRLKAKKDEFFPIFRQEKGWIWLEKVI